MDVAKLTIGNKVYTNLTGAQAALRIKIHNELPPFLNMQNFARKIEHMQPRASSMGGLLSDQIILKAPTGTGKTKTGGLDELIKEMEKRHEILTRFEPIGWSDFHTMIDKNGKTHVLPEFKLSKNYIDFLKETLYKESDGKIKLNENITEEVMKKRASQKITFLTTNDFEKLDPEIAKRLKKDQ